MTTYHKDKCVEKANNILTKEHIYSEIWYDANIPVIYVQIDNGDWKHEHLRAKFLLSEAGFDYIGSREIGNSESDTYSAIHNFICSHVEV